MPKAKTEVKEEKAVAAPEAMVKPAEAEAEVEKLDVEKDVIEAVPEEEAAKPLPGSFDLAAWTPKTDAGKKVKSGEIKDIDVILNAGIPILEAPIVDILLPNLETDLLFIGQSKGKFGGGQKRIFRQTQKKSPEGNKPSFGVMAVAGNRDGYVGIGYGKGKDTVPAREKSLRNAKLSVIKVKRGCGSWQCNCKTPHSVPFTVEGKCGSAVIRLMPAPKGKGLVVEPNCQKILALAGFKDVWSKTFGQTRNTNNLATACFEALKKLSTTKVSPETGEKLGMHEGKIAKV
ncbi:MAG TPA: 30S ribosomal protein S5 [Candidatus Binatia bacterium]|nr:30S ribosomal protein S5 [Candidatus Binatia bacterium]